MTNIPSAKLQEHVKNHANNKIATWTNNFHYPCPRRHHYCEFCEKEFSNVDHTLFDQHMKVVHRNIYQEIFHCFSAKQVWYFKEIFSVKKHLNMSERSKLWKLGNFPVDKIKQWFEIRHQFENIHNNTKDLTKDQPEIIEIS